LQILAAVLIQLCSSRPGCFSARSSRKSPATRLISHTITFSDTEKYLEMKRLSMSRGISCEVLGPFHSKRQMFGSFGKQAVDRRDGLAFPDTYWYWKTISIYF
jgi:hypothetical protein